MSAPQKYVIIVASAIEGPNGIGVFRPSPLNRNTIKLTTRPIKEDKNSANNVCGVPRTKPMIRNNLRSPPPIPPFERIATQNNIVNPIHAPIKPSIVVNNEKFIRNMKISEPKKHKILFGINMYEISDTEIIINIEKNKSAINNSTSKPSIR